MDNVGEYKVLCEKVEILQLSDVKHKESLKALHKRLDKDGDTTEHTHEIVLKQAETLENHLKWEENLSEMKAKRDVWTRWMLGVTFVILMALGKLTFITIYDNASHIKSINTNIERLLI